MTTPRPARSVTSPAAGERPRSAQAGSASVDLPGTPPPVTVEAARRRTVRARRAAPVRVVPSPEPGSAGPGDAEPGPAGPQAAGRADTLDAGTPDAERVGTSSARQPLYPRLIRLQHVHPNAWQRALLGEGALAAAGLLVMADLATAWTLVVLPIGVAAFVKSHDVLAGLLARRTPVG